MPEQQVFIELVTLWIASCRPLPFRCDAAAAMSFACVARSGRRWQLSAWAWRAMRQCEVEHVRHLDEVESRYRRQQDRFSQVLDDYFNVRVGNSLERSLYEVLGEALEHLGVVTRLLTRRPELRAEVDALRPVARDSLGADDLVNEASSELDLDSNHAGSDAGSEMDIDEQ